MTRETWTSRVGFLLAAVGSAVGLGNIWRFPWIAAENGGSAFLIAYLAVVLAVGVPGLLGAFVVGRRSHRNPVGALRDLSGSRRWGAVGGLSVVASVVLLSFYSVVGGWVLRYLGLSVAAVLGGPAAYAADPAAHFGRVSFGAGAAAFHLLFLSVTAGVVVGGVRAGIERATKVMVPAILALLIGLAAWASLRPDAGAGYAFFLRFDAATLREEFFAVVGPAAGQALFTLSLGAGTMITYASYLGEDRSLPADSTAIAAVNTLVGVLAGLVVFPLLFSLGIDPASTGTGAGALFVGLTGAFAQMPAGDLIATAFFGVVALAALSSSISILEIPVSFLVDEAGYSRRRATGALAALIAATGTVNAFRPELFGFVAGPLVNALLTAGLIATLLFVGWVMGEDAVAEFATGAGAGVRRLGTPWLFAAGVILPVFLTFTLLTSLQVDAHLGFWPTVAAAAALSLAVAAGVRRPNSVV